MADILPVTNLKLGDNDEELEKLAAGMADVLEEGHYTYDMPELNRKKHHYIFVYGTLKKDFANHPIIRSQLMVGCGYTSSDCFIMGIEKSARFPVALFCNDVDYRAKIYGEVYRVSPFEIRTLDNLESNGHLYKRYPLSIDCCQQDGKKQTIYAWTYIGISNWWKSRRDRLEPAMLCKNEQFKYYLYTKKDQSPKNVEPLRHM